MKADKYGPPSDQTRYWCAWKSATDADAAGVSRDSRCGQCVHQTFSETARGARAQCQLGGATTLRATCAKFLSSETIPALGSQTAKTIVVALRLSGMRRGGVL